MNSSSRAWCSNPTVKKLTFAFDPRSFVVGISNYTQHACYWSWTVYFGPFFVQFHILKPRRLRRRWGNAV